MAACETIRPRWTECVVAATGPSLTKEVAEAVRGQNVIAVNDAYRIMPFAQVLYACDTAWWDAHEGCPGFEGEKWSSHEVKNKIVETNDKTELQKKYGLRLVQGKTVDGFSFDPSVIHYGQNSGFQAINLAILFGAKRIVLVGFDMHGGNHFFGAHPAQLRMNTDCRAFIPSFEKAAEMLRGQVDIINCTPGSALTCFRRADLHDALAGTA